MSSGLDSDQDRCSGGPDLFLNCLQILSTDAEGHSHGLTHLICIVYLNTVVCGTVVASLLEYKI